MPHAPGSLSAELALEILADGPLGPEDICRRALALRELSQTLAERLCLALMGDDPRFRRRPDGLWEPVVQTAADGLLARASFVVVDVETTGFRPPGDRVIELGCVRLRDGRMTDRFETLLNPRRPVPGPITGLTGISWSMLADKPTFEQICPEFLDFLGDSVFVAHNAPFDWRFIQSEVSLAVGRKLLNQRICTRAMSRRLLPEVRGHGLDEVARFFNLEFEGRHRAFGDALVTAEVLLRFLDRAAERGITTLAALMELLKPLSRGGKRRKT